MLPTKEFFQSVLRERLDDKSVVVKEIKSTNPDNVGLHIASSTGFFNASYVDGNGNEQEMSVFVKRQVADPVLKRPNAMSDDQFRKERCYYERLYPDMVRFCQEHAKRPVDISKIPRFLYSAKDEDGKEILALEDVSSRGFEVLPFVPTERTDIVKAKLILRLMATMHAVSYAMQKKKDIDMTKKYDFLHNGLVHEKQFEVFITNTLKAAADILASEPQTEQLAKKFLKLQPYIWNLYLEGLEPRKTFSAVCHADAHPNNMLFRKDAAGNFVDILLLDWQAVRYSSVVADIHMALSQADPSIDINELRRFYYDTFKDTMDAFGLANDLFTFEDFLGEIDDLKVVTFTGDTMEVTFVAFMMSGLLEKAMAAGANPFPLINNTVNTVNAGNFMPPPMKPMFINKLKAHEKYVDECLQALNL